MAPRLMPLLVAEAPTPTCTGARPLAGRPTRFLERLSGRGPGWLRQGFRFRHLLDRPVGPRDPFPLAEGRLAAWELMGDLLRGGRSQIVIVVGGRAARAFPFRIPVGRWLAVGTGPLTHLFAALPRPGSPWWSCPERARSGAALLEEAHGGEIAAEGSGDG